MTYKHLFSRSLSAKPDRLHFAAHSHHLWPDAALEGHLAAWHDAASWADRKWAQVYGHVLPTARTYIATELNLPDPNSLVFAQNTHELVMRLFSTLPRGARILTTDGEFHSFRRQSMRLEEAGAITVTRVPVAPFVTFATRFADAVAEGGWDMVFVSHVFFNSGHVFDDALTLWQHLPASCKIVIDGYHGFMALPTDLAASASRQYYLSGGYKYAMSGEGACFMHCPPGDERPRFTGWFAEFEPLHAPAAGGVGYPQGAQRYAGSTYDPTPWYRFNAVQAMLHDEGLSTAAISGHVRTLQQDFLALVRSGAAGALRNAVVLNDITTPRHARFVAFLHPKAAQWQHDLQTANVITDVRGDVLRFGFGIYHDHSDVEALAGVVSATLRA